MSVVADTITIFTFRLPNSEIIRTTTTDASITAAHYNAVVGTTISTLAEIAFGSLVTAIAADAFKGCTNLLHATFMTRLTEEGVVADANKLVIGAGAFSGCTNLRGVYNLHNTGIATIPANCFLNCSAALRAFSIPASVTTIQTDAFKGCTVLARLTYHDAAAIITHPSTAFTDTPALLDVTYYNASSIADIAPTLSANQPGNAVYTYLQYNETRITYSSGVTVSLPGPSITSSDLTANNNTIATIIRVDIGTNITSIGNNAFQNCTALKAVRAVSFVIGTPTLSVFVFGTSSFQGCSVLEHVALPYNVTAIAANCFAQCTAIPDMYIPEGVRTIGSNAFSNSTTTTTSSTLRECILPRSLASIGSSAFFRSNLAHANMFHTKVTSIGDLGFAGSPNHLPFVAGGSTTALKYLSFSPTLTTINQNAFNYCRGLGGNIVFPASITTIGQTIFAYGGTGVGEPVRNFDFSLCTQLTTLPNGLSYVSKLNVPKFPPHITALGGTFQAATFTDPKVIIIPSTLTNLGSSTFDTSNLQQLIFEPRTSGFQFGTLAFRNCGTLNRVVNLPDSITTIPTGCFGSNDGTTNCLVQFYDNYGNITKRLPSSLTTIKNLAFRRCNAITSILIPAATTTIEASAFALCTAITNFAYENAQTPLLSVAPNSLDINRSAALTITYYNASSYSDLPLTLKTQQNQLWTNTTFVYEPYHTKLIFSGSTGTGIVYLTDADNLSALTAAIIQARRDTLTPADGITPPTLISVVFGANTTAIAASAFANQTTLTSVSFATAGTFTISAIPDNCFNGCTSMATCTNIPKSITTIGASAFNATNISSIVIPGAVTTIGANAFDNCAALTSLTYTNAWSVNGVGVNTLSGTHPTLNITYNQSVNADDLPASLVSQQGEVDARPGNTATYTYILAGAVMVYSDAPTRVFYDTFIIDVNTTHMSRLSTLQKVGIGHTITSIGANAFNGATNLTTLVVGVSSTGTSSLVSIGDNAFLNCALNGPLALAPSVITAIGGNAFQGNAALSGVTFPNTNTLKTIGHYAFQGCGISGAITLTVGIVSIGDHAFQNNIGLQLTAFPASLTTIGTGAFRDCGISSTLTWTNATTLTSIGADAFRNNGSLKIASSAFPASLTSLSAGVFYGCGILGSITIPSTLTVIEAGAFYGNGGLTGVTFPTTIKTIGADAFRNCGITSTFNWSTANSLTSIGSDAFRNNPLLNIVKPSAFPVALTTLSAGVFNGCGITGAITLPTALTDIGEGAFYGNGGLTGVTFPTTIKTIGAEAFRNCGISATLTWASASTLTEIGADAFRNNPALTIAASAFPNGFTTLGDGAFYGCGITGSKSISNTAITSLPDNVFYGNGSLTEITLPAALTSIGSNTFRGCGLTTAVSFGAAMTSIGNDAFNGNISLPSVTFPSMLSVVGSGVFRGCNALTSVSFGTNTVLTALPESIFYGCIALTSIAFPSHIAIIGTDAFRNCTTLASITFASNEEANITTISEGAFRGCAALISISIPKTTESIGNSAFQDCTNLAAVDYYVDGIVDIENGNSISSLVVGTNVLEGTAQSITITYYNAYNVDDLNTSLQAQQTELGISATNPSFIYVTFNTVIEYTVGNSTVIERFAATELTRAMITTDVARQPNQIANVIIGIHTTALGVGLFQSCGSLTAVGFVDNVSIATLPVNCFRECSQLARVSNIPTDIASIGNNCFDGCASLQFYSSATAQQSLTTMPFPNITTIGASAFYGCGALGTGITFGSTGLDAIGTSAFQECVNITGITFNSAILTAISDSCFQGCTALTVCNLASASTITSFGASAFRYCAALTSIVLPQGGVPLTLIGANAFQDCALLTALNLTTSALTSIGASAFQGCASLMALNLSAATLSAIQPFTFYGCAALVGLDLATAPLSAIGDSAFYGCTSITSITLAPDLAGLTSIGDSAFHGCVALDGLDLDTAPLTAIGASAFQNCAALSAIDLSAALLIEIQPFTFFGCTSISTISLAADLTDLARIGESAFYGCVVLDGLDLSTAQLNSIGASAFQGCAALTEIAFSSALETFWYIPMQCFYGCTSLAAVIDIPPNVTVVESSAFQGCANMQFYVSDPLDPLTPILRPGLPSNCVYIGDNAYNGCALFNFSTEYLVPPSLYQVGAYAFAGCTSLSTFILTNDCHLGAISTGMFSGATSLSSVALSLSVQAIGSYAFNGCAALPSIGIPSDILSIGAYAWNGASALTDIMVYDARGTPTIDPDATTGASALARITYYRVTNSPPSAAGITQQYQAHQTTLQLREPPVEFIYVGIGSAVTVLYYSDAVTGENPGSVAVEATDGTFSFVQGETIPPGTVLNRIILGSDVVTLSIGCFANISTLVECVTTDAVQLTTIGDNAFANTEITSISIPARVTAIGASAFAGLPPLDAITFYNAGGITSVGANAFDLVAGGEDGPTVTYYNAANDTNVPTVVQSAMSGVTTQTVVYNAGDIEKPQFLIGETVTIYNGGGAGVNIVIPAINTVQAALLNGTMGNSDVPTSIPAEIGDIFSFQTLVQSSASQMAPIVGGNRLAPTARLPIHIELNVVNELP